MNGPFRAGCPWLPFPRPSAWAGITSLSGSKKFTSDSRGAGCQPARALAVSAAGWQPAPQDVYATERYLILMLEHELQRIQQRPGQVFRGLPALLGRSREILDYAHSLRG